MFANTLPNNLIFSTVHLHLLFPDSTSTGFFYEILNEDRRHILVVTNSHALPIGIGEYNLQIPLKNASENNEEPAGDNLIVDGVLHEKFVIRHPDPDVDLCCFELISLKTGSLPAGFSPFVRSFSRDLIPPEDKRFDAIEALTMVGYPSGLYDSVNCIPIVRRGITATPLNYDFEGRKEFIVDMAVTPGSSGSPVVICDTNGYMEIDDSGELKFNLGEQRLILVGILKNAFIRNEEGSGDGNLKFSYQNWINLGTAIKSCELIKLEEAFLTAEHG